MGTAHESTMRRFVLHRDVDATGTSGTGVVAEGVEFSDGHVSLHWLTQYTSVAVYGNVRVLLAIHGHGGNTSIRWIDEEGK